MDQNNCFVCADDCTNSYFFLINLSSKKYKTKYTSLIGDLINPEYELRLTSENKICKRCSVLLEKYDELQHETLLLKGVLSRQVAHTYEIETSEEMVFLDKSKVFVETNPAHANLGQYSCKLCPRFITDSLDTVNAHIMYHKIQTDDQIHANEVLKEIAPPQKRQQGIARETSKRPEQTKTKTNPQPARKINVLGIEKVETIETEEFDVIPQNNNIQDYDMSIMNIQAAEYDEETLDSLIDLNLLEDPMYESNLKNPLCMVNGCKHEFVFMNDYVRHLKLEHKSTLNHIFAVVRANIKRPTRVSKFMCPYCFTKTSDSQSLEQHVRQHEEAGKSNMFTDRVSDFLKNVMNSTRCSTCDSEIIDHTVLDCTHEISRNGLVQKKTCCYCEQYFYNDKLLNNHLATDHGHCFVCALTCEDKLVLKDHIRSHMSHVEYTCPFCNNLYQTKADGLDHIKKQHSDHCCFYCDEWSLDKNELDHHTRYAHADKIMEQEKHSFCDMCGASFKNRTLLTNHQRFEHAKRKVFNCTTCNLTFQYRYLLMDHISNVHKRTVVDNETNFYKCFVCQKGYSSLNRKAFIHHLNEHKLSTCFCNDCNVNLQSIQHLEAHRERSHQDFSILVDKKMVQKSKAGAQQTPVKEPPKPIIKVVPKATPSTFKKQPFKNDSASVSEVYEQKYELLESTEEDDQFSVKDEPQQQQIMVQTEDGSLLNMNNIILTENGELIIQNLDGLLPNEQESGDDGSGGQIHISNLEQFLIEQGLSGGQEISYIQPDDNQVIIQNEDGTVSQSSQGSLMQTYKEIFEPDEDIPTELIQSSEVHDDVSAQNIMLNGDYMVQSVSDYEQHNSNGQVVEQIEIQNTVQVDANQSTLDELGDILLEVAAAAEKEKKPKSTDQKIRDSLWGTRKRPTNTHPLLPRKKQCSRFDTELKGNEEEAPASNFSQAYEIFVKGFGKKNSKM